MQTKLLARARQRYAPSTGMLLCLVAASLLPLLCACSTAPLRLPTPELEASLAQSCPPVPPRPTPLVDPDRSGWELGLLAAYGECAARHRHTVDAWPKSK